MASQSNTYIKEFCLKTICQDTAVSWTKTFAWLPQCSYYSINFRVLCSIFSNLKIKKVFVSKFWYVLLSWFFPRKSAFSYKIETISWFLDFFGFLFLCFSSFWSSRKNFYYFFSNLFVLQIVEHFFCFLVQHFIPLLGFTKQLKQNKIENIFAETTHSVIPAYQRE